MKLSAHNFQGFNKCHVFAAQGKGDDGVKILATYCFKESSEESHRLDEGEVRCFIDFLLIQELEPIRTTVPMIIMSRYIYADTVLNEYPE